MFKDAYFLLTHNYDRESIKIIPTMSNYGPAKILNPRIVTTHHTQTDKYPRVLCAKLFKECNDDIMFLRTHLLSNVF